ncbi:MAG: hypothetical protein KAS73_03965 [Candidatus Sabulitectum sp.]|nr:hypothetical protein [Candidatus Sabulitectum sp.]
MRKLLIVLALLAVTAFASDPRLTVLGDDARLLVNDYLEMWAYPGVIGDYEFVTGGSETAGDVSDGWFGIVDGLGGNAYGVTINHNNYNHEILFSPGGWGAILSMNFDKWAPTDTTTRKDIAVGLAWGTDVPFLADYSDLAFAVGFDNTAIDYEETERTISDMMFGASLRGHSNDFFNLFPIIGADVSYHDVNDYDDTSINTTTIHVDFGAGRNKKVGDKTNLVLGVFTDLQVTSHGGDYAEDATPDSEMWIEIPRVTGGVEQEIGKWLIFRAGAASVSEYYSTGDFNQFTSGFETNFGVGLHWDNFIMDATITEGFLHDGPYMVGGTDNGFMGSLAATYNF